MRKNNIEMMYKKYSYTSTGKYDRADKARFNYALKLDPNEYLTHTYENLYKDKSGVVKRDQRSMLITRGTILKYKLYCDARNTCDKCPLDNICYVGFEDYTKVGLYDDI